MRIDDLVPAERNLERLAAQEAAGIVRDRGPQPRANQIPLPPGIDPEVLARRDQDDPRAWLTLDEALAAVADAEAKVLLPEPVVKTPPPADPDRQDEALRLYARGRSAALDNNHLRAVIDLQKALELDPDAPEILRELARSYAANGNTGKAVDLYQKMLADDPKNSEALFTVGLAAANRRDFQRATEALSRLRRAGVAFDHDPAAGILADFTLSIALRELGYDRASIAAATSALELPDQFGSRTGYGTRLASVYRQRGETWRGIGDAHARLGEFSEALRAYAQAASLPTPDPTALHPRVIYANLCMERIFTAQLELLHAITVATDGSSITPTTDAPPTTQPATGPDSATVRDRDIHLCSYLRENAQPTDLLARAVADRYRAEPEDGGLARAAAALMPPGEGLALLREFIARRPRDLQAVSHLLLWLAERDVQSAVALTVALVNDEPDLAAEYTDRLGWAGPRMSEVLDAAAALREAPRSGPAEVLVEGRLLAMAGAFGPAWTLCENALRKFPADPALIILRIELAAALDEPALVRQAIAAHPGADDLPTLLAQARAWRAVRDHDQAIAAAQRAVGLDENDAEAHTELGRAHAAGAMTLASGSAAGDDEARAAALQAITAAERAIALQPAAEHAHEVMIAMYSPGAPLADDDQLRQTVRRLYDANPDSRLYARLAAQESAGQRRYEQALERLITLYEAQPSDRASLSAAVSAWQAWDRLDIAEQWLDERLSRRPGDPMLLEQWTRVQLLRDPNGGGRNGGNRSVAAIERLQSLLVEDPRNYPARQLLESLYRSAGQTERALELGEERLLTRPEGSRRAIELAALYAGSGRSRDASRHLAWLLDHGDRSTLDHLSSAIGIAGRLEGMDTRREELTLALVQQTIRQFPAASMQVYGSGLRALARLGPLDERFDALADQAAANAPGAAEAAPQELAAWQDLAQALIDADQPLAAARALRARWRAEAGMTPASVSILARMTFAADAAAGGQAEASIKLIKKLDEQNRLPEMPGMNGPPTRSEVCMEVSQMYSLVGDLDGAERLLLESIRLQPDDAMVLNNLGYMRLEAGRGDDQTIQWIERAHELMPHENNILDTIGWLRYKQGRLADEPGSDPDQDPPDPQPGAITLIRESLEDFPESSAEVLDHLGDALWRSGDLEGAKAAWNRAAGLLSEPATRQETLQNYQLVQSRLWGLVVRDPQAMYDRDFGVVLERIQAKLKAAEDGLAPAVEPTFAEAAGNSRE